MYALLRYLPRKLLSRLTGVLVEIPLPRFLLDAILNNFVKSNKIDVSEFAEPLSSFKTFGQFFTRELKPECRLIETDIVSPVDGSIESVQLAQDGQCIQAKGIEYSVSELIGTSEFEAGEVYTIYLAPRDYHHIHIPADSKLEDRQHILGTLWPVNAWSVENIPKVFCVNERVVLRLSAEFGEFYLVMVGATNVGSIGLSFEQLRTNRAGQSYSKKSYGDLDLKKGQKAGTFFLGSTVILLFPKGKTVSSLDSGTVKMGQTIAKHIS